MKEVRLALCLSVRLDERQCMPSSFLVSPSAAPYGKAWDPKAYALSV